ncbi:MAG: hypothetical protein JWP20_1799 [Roseomonas sp.]|jgi:hypothetical protein|nr:hypothetical protein [Roseomonas sp.]
MVPCTFLLLPFFAISATAMDGGPELRTLPQGVAYCQELAGRLAPLPGAAREPARSLAAEGSALCRDGHVRTGVAKLRRALRAAQGR